MTEETWGKRVLTIMYNKMKTGERGKLLYEAFEGKELEYFVNMNKYLNIMGARYNKPVVDFFALRFCILCN